MRDQNVIEQIRSHYKNLKLQDANEAETRLKLINDIIFRILGWGIDDVSVESRVSEDGATKFADYILTTANVSIIVEAKKVGESFLINPSNRRVQLNKAFVKNGVGEAIRQARDYCRKKSIPFGIVTNGNQWIIFPALRIDGVSFEQSSAYVFSSLDQILDDDYDLFVSLLSRDSVIDGELQYQLLGRTSDQVENRRLSSFYKQITRDYRNPIFPHIEHAIVTAFTESIVEQSIDLLKKCYVVTPDRTKFDSRIKMHVQQRISVFNKAPIRPLKGSGKSEVKLLLESATRRARPLAVLVLGSVGAGKTTFLHYTRNVSAADVFNHSTANGVYSPQWLYIDFRMHEESGSPVDFMCSQILDIFKSGESGIHQKWVVQAAYKHVEDLIKSGPLSVIGDDDRAIRKALSDMIMDDFKKVNPYVECILKKYSSETPLFIVIDNVDQFEDEVKQSKIFSECIAFAMRVGANLVLSMREQTFVKHKNTPAFDAFDYDAIKIDPPDIQSVLSKRFFLAATLLEGKACSFSAPNAATVHVDDLSLFVDILQSSVLGTFIGNAIASMSTGDSRLALRMTREFIERGYTDPAKAIRYKIDKRPYTMPRHEALRAILLGKNSVYKERASVIGNLLDSHLGKVNCQLLRLFICAALYQKAHMQEDGKILCGEVVRHCKSMGFSENDVYKVIEDLFRLRFIHTNGYESPNEASSIFCTRLTGIVVSDLLFNFSFLECMVMDTYISEKSVWDDLFELSQLIDSERNVSKRVELRSQRLIKFYDHISAGYLPLATAAASRSLPPEWCSNPLLEGRRLFEKSIEIAVESARNHYG